jgi:hypothetical protein
MSNLSNAIEFTLQPAGCPPVRVRLRRGGDRWAAEVSGQAVGLGIATTAGLALAAALEPLGGSAVTRLMADLGLLEPSLQVVELERATSA